MPSLVSNWSLAIESLQRDALPSLSRLAQRLSFGNTAAADDLIQDTVARAMRQGLPANVPNPRTWLAVIMLNLFVDRCRYTARRPVHNRRPKVHDNVTPFGTDSPSPEPAWSHLTIEQARAALDAIEEFRLDARNAELEGVLASFLDVVNQRLSAERPTLDEQAKTRAHRASFTRLGRYATRRKEQLRKGSRDANSRLACALGLLACALGLLWLWPLPVWGLFAWTTAAFTLAIAVYASTLLRERWERGETPREVARGLGAVMDVGATHRRRVRAEIAISDWDAIENDWEAVGGDLRECLKEFKVVVQSNSVR